MNSLWQCVIRVALFLILILESHSFSESLKLHDMKNLNDQLDLSGEWSIRDIDSETWHRIHVPKYLNVAGKWIYRYEFVLDSTFQAHSCDIFFQGIDGAFSVYLNEKYIGSRNGPAMPISFPVNGAYLRIGSENTLIVECSTRLHAVESLPVRARYRGIPPRNGGIFRPVWIRSWSAPRVRNVELEIRDNRIQNLGFVLPEPPDVFSAEIFDLMEDKVIWQESKRRLSQDDSLHSLYPDLALLPWTPTNPRRYRLSFQLTHQNNTERTSVDFFVRPAWEKKDWRSLLGETETVKMVEWTEDLTLRTLAPDSFYSVLENDVALIKDLGCNAIRILGDPPPDSLVSLCNKKGIMLLIELPIRYTPGDILRDEEFRKLADRAMGDMVTHYKRYPAVAAWGVGAGYVVDSKSLDFIAFLKDRHIQRNNLPSYWVDPIFTSDSLEIPVEFTISSSKTHSPLSLARIQVLLSANGLTKLEREGLQASRLQDILQNMEGSKNSGLVFAPFRDYRGDTPFLLWGPRPNTNILRGGLLDVHSQQRPIFQVLKSWFTERPMPRVLQEQENKAPTLTFLLSGLAILILLLFMIKTDRRFAQYLQRLFFFSHGFYTDLTENRQVNKYLTVFAGSTSLATLTVVIASMIHYLHSNWVFDFFLTWLFPDQALKYRVVWIIWHPVALMGIILLFFMVFILFQVIFIKILTLFQNRNIRVSQIFTFFLWVPVNFYLLLPLALVIYRALDRPGFHLPMLIYTGAIMIWFIIRSFRGLQVLLQFSALKLVVFSLILLIIVSGVFIVALQPQLYLTGYIPYYFDLYNSVR